MIFFIKESLKYILRSKTFIQSEIKEIDEYYKISDDELYKIKEIKFIELFKSAYLKSSFYKEFYDSHGISINDIVTLDDIEKLPILTKDMVRENFNRMLTVPNWRVFKTKTSGTTGSQLTLYHDLKSIRKERAYIWVNRKNYGFIYGEPLVSLRGQMKKKYFKKYIKVSNTLFLSPEKINKDSIIEYYKNIVKFKPKAIEGYPSTLYYLCLFLSEKNLKLKIPYTFTSSETLLDFQRDLISDIFQTELYDYYGCTEKTIALSERKHHDGYFENPGYSINEYKEDCVICTSLINNSFPLIRYKMNDRINYETDKSGAIRILSVFGRSEDVVIDKSGSIISRWNNFFKGTENIALAQIFQEKKGEITIKVVPKTGFSENDKKNLLKKIDEKIGLKNIDVEFKLVKENEIIYSSRNKFRLVVSEV